jgi:ubiquitin carboxyl-terminal hydrolase 10
MMAPSSRKIGRPTKYKLFGGTCSHALFRTSCSDASAVLYHHGQSASGGHYTLDVLHPNRDLSTKPREAWIRIDDELVSDVTPDDVFGGLERDDRCAYLLFYRKIGGGTRP